MGSYLLMAVGIGLAIFVLYMLVVTCSLGTERLKVPQFLMSSLTYSEEAAIKINMLIDKYEAGLLNITRTEKILMFTDASTSAKVGEIWIGSKYYSYGILHRYGASGSNEWACNKPDIKTFKRIIKLEKSLEKADSSVNVQAAPSTAKNEKEEVILD